jgi:hypothetical protein
MGMTQGLFASTISGRHGQHVHPGVDGFLTYRRKQKLCYIAGGNKDLRD